MTREVARKSRIADRLIYVFLALAASYWLIQSGTQAFIFHEGPFLEQVLDTDSYELSMRLVSVSFLVGLGVVCHLFMREHNRVQDELRASERDKATVLDSLLELVTYQDRELKIAWANRAAVEAAGPEAQPLVGRHCYEVWQQRREPCPGCPVKKAIDTGEPHEGEITAPDGRIWFVHGYPVRDEQGNVVGAVESTLEITERKKAEVELRHSKELLQAIEHTTADGLVVVDRDCNVTWQNKQIELYNGKVVGKKCYEVFEGRTSRCPHCVHPAVLADGKPRGYETTVRTSAGDVRVWVRAAPLRDASGNIIGILEASRDIGERKEAEEELRRQRDKAQGYLDIAGVIIIAIGADEKVTLINRQGCEVLGLGEDEIVGKNWFDHFLPERIRADVKMAFDKLMAGEVTLIERFENPVFTKSGQERIIAWHNTVLKDESGKIIGTLSSGLDITERKQAEKELAMAAKQWQSTLDAIRDMVMVVDKDFRVLRANRAALEAFPDRKVIGEHSFELFQGRKRPLKNCPVRKTFDSGESACLELHEEGPDGRWLEISTHPITNGNGEVQQVVNVIRNVTERKQLQSRDTQEQKLQSIGQLAAGIAHEINTPTQYVGDNTRFLQDAFGGLTGVVGKYAELLRAHKEGSITPELVADIEAAAKKADLDYLNEEIPRAFEESLQGIERVSKIVKSMRAFAHPDSGEKTFTDINESIESTITVSRNEWKYVADVVTDFDPDLPLVPCLPGEFNQVVLNMIVNAAHGIAGVVGDGSNGKGKITVSTCRNGDWAEIRISDTGTGIPEEHRAKIFDPFFTTKEVGKGTGQGLAIAYDVIAQKHGGTITFDTEDGRGTTFVVRLPIGASTAPEEVRDSTDYLKPFTSGRRNNTET